MCMSIKWKQPFSVKAVYVPECGKKMIPMWKVLKRKAQSIGLESAMYGGFTWNVGVNHSGRTDTSPTARDISDQYVSKGFHCYLRKADAEEAVPHMHACDRASVIRVYVDPDHLVAKGWSFRFECGFKTAEYANRLFDTPKDVEKYSDGKAYATAVVTAAYITRQDFLGALGLDDVLNALGYGVKKAEVETEAEHIQWSTLKGTRIYIRSQ